MVENIGQLPMPATVLVTLKTKQLKQLKLPVEVFENPKQREWREKWRERERFLQRDKLSSK